MLIRVTLATSYSFAAKTRLDVLRRSLGLGTREPASPFYSFLFYARQPNRRECINLTTYRFASFGATLSDRGEVQFIEASFLHIVRYYIYPAVQWVLAKESRRASKAFYPPLREDIYASCRLITGSPYERRRRRNP